MLARAHSLAFMLEETCTLSGARRMVDGPPGVSDGEVKKVSRNKACWHQPCRSEPARLCIVISTYSAQYDVQPTKYFQR